MKTRQIRNDFGLEINGIDLSSPLAGEQFEKILDYYYQYLVLVFPNQSLKSRTQAEFYHCPGDCRS